jgi:hypothetical protein
MLRKIANQENEEFMKPVEIGDLSVLTNDITIANLNQAAVLQLSHDTPECALATPRLATYRRRLGIDLLIVATETEQPQNYLPLSAGELARSCQKISNLVILFYKQSQRQYSLRLWHTIRYSRYFTLNHYFTIWFYWVLMVCHASCRSIRGVGRILGVDK